MHRKQIQRTTINTVSIFGHPCFKHFFKEKVGEIRETRTATAEHDLYTCKLECTMNRQLPGFCETQISNFINTTDQLIDDAKKEIWSVLL